jgi:hypothetical protein
VAGQQARSHDFLSIQSKERLLGRSPAGLTGPSYATSLLRDRETQQVKCVDVTKPA